MNMEEIREEAQRDDGADGRKEGVRVRVVRGDYWEIGTDAGLVCECGPNWTVRELKLHLQASLPDVPEAECLRVICAGRELRDEEVMAAVVPRGASAPYTLHVINAGRLHRRFVYPAPSAPTAPSAPAPLNPTTASAPTQNADPAGANEDFAMTYWQQAYRSYYYQSMLCQYWAMAYEREAAAAGAPAAAAAPAAPQVDQPAPVQAREQLPEEEEGDWWERAYGVFRLCAVVCLMYAYSTTGRIILLLVVLVALMVVRPGQWRRLQAAQRPAALQPEDPEILMPEEPAPEAPAAEAPAAEALAPEVPAPDAPAPDAPPRHSLFAAGWLIITTFFTSLIPDVTE